jgi:hypothetical protein
MEERGRRKVGRNISYTTSEDEESSYDTEPSSSQANKANSLEKRVADLGECNSIHAGKIIVSQVATIYRGEDGKRACKSW